MNETAERRQGAENACQRLRRRVLTATAALAAAALVFGWLAAGAVYYCQVEAVGKKEAAVRIQLFDRVQGGAPGEGAPFQVYAIQSRGLATPGQAWQALTG